MLCSSTGTKIGKDICLSEGPEAIYEFYTQGPAGSELRDRLASFLEAGTDCIKSVSGYLSIPIEKLWKMRDEKPPAYNGTQWLMLLDDIEGEGDVCEFMFIFYMLSRL